MAITLADFNKIWASTSPLTPYSFSESNYKQGWNFIGSTPPARQMWDYLQKNNDEKMQYLANNYLPLTGGTLTGQLTLNAQITAFTDKFAKLQSNYANSEGLFSINGGNCDNDGARLVLYGKNYGDSSGSFYIIANNGSVSKTFQARSDGSLKWDNNDIALSKDVLALSGGTINGTVKFSTDSALSRNTTDGEFIIYGGEANFDSPCIALRGQERTTDAGTLYIMAKNTSQSKILIAKPDGTFTWGGNNVITSAGGTINGSLNTTRINNKFDFVKGTVPSTIKRSSIYFTDKDGDGYGANCIGLVESQVTTQNLSRTSISAIKNEANSTVACEISVNVDGNGNVYTSAPTPANRDNSTKIATTAFVQSNYAPLYKAYDSQPSLSVPTGQYILIAYTIANSIPSDTVCYVGIIGGSVGGNHIGVSDIKKGSAFENLGLSYTNDGTNITVSATSSYTVISMLRIALF